VQQISLVLSYLSRVSISYDNKRYSTILLELSTSYDYNLTNAEIGTPTQNTREPSEAYRLGP